MNQDQAEWLILGLNAVFLLLFCFVIPYLYNTGGSK